MRFQELPDSIRRRLHARRTQTVPFLAVAAVLFLVAFQQGLQDCEVRSQFDCRRRRAVGGLFRSGVGEGRLLLLGRYSAVRGVVIPRRAR